MSEVDICNLALSNLGARASIADMDEDSTEARVCSLHFDPARDLLLREHDWNFARVRVALASVDTLTGWSYGYALPDECLRFRGIYNGIGWRTRPMVAYELGAVRNTDGSLTPAVFTDTEDAEGIYTSRVTNVAFFDPLFTDALSWAISARIALDITGKHEVQLNAAKVAETMRERAMVADANEGPQPVEHLPDWLTIRGYVA